MNQWHVHMTFHSLRLIQKLLNYTFCNLGSLEIRASTYISAKLKKRTYMYDSQQFPVEMNTRGSKTDNFYSFSHEVWLTGTVLIIFSQLLAEWYVMTSKQF